MKKLILFLMLLPLVGVSQLPKLGAVITTNPPTTEVFSRDTILTSSGISSGFVPYNNPKFPDKIIEVSFKNNMYGNYDFAKVVLPKDTTGAIIGLVKQYLKVCYELDSIKLVLYKTRVREIQTYDKLLKMLK